MAGVETADSVQPWADIHPDDIKKSFYEETPGIAILSSFQLSNVFTILSLAAWLVNYDNKDYINVAAMILGAIFFVYNICRYKVLVSYIDLHEKWRNKSSNQRLSITKTYALITIITFFLSLWLVN
ncbi:MAG: hypothetical protein EA361_07335 [Bacteroidetes bacterium]|nr:MAG: hypothetical protein EA361_07335 [Bacteroidota bacterium]